MQILQILHVHTYNLHQSKGSIWVFLYCKIYKYICSCVYIYTYTQRHMSFSNAFTLKGILMDCVASEGNVCCFCIFTGL